ncbi:MAG: hypothetical protein JSV89_03460 [Spirochaetaceae bacterium]|nr:MAG: hypothetical protein JSV89_03460 [Spirochaetaceae bacterium]
MKRANQRFRLVVLILVAGALIAGGTIYLIFSETTRRRSKAAQLDVLLAEADYDISLGYYDRSLETLDRAFKQARGEYNILRVLKRVYQISYDLNDFFILNHFARDAVENIPGSNELAEIYLYASIRSESSPRAVELLKRGRGDIAYLHAEGFLEGYIETLPDVEQDFKLKQIVSLVGPRGAENRSTGPRYTVPRYAGPSDPHELQRLGTDLDEPRILLDAALLWMQQGDVDSAFTLVNRHMGDPLFQEPSIYISYDAGSEQVALSLIQEQQAEGRGADRLDLRIMEADLHLLLGNSEDAMRLYREIISTDPGYSWTPYLNSALISGRSGNSTRVLREMAYANFPDIGPVVRSYTRSLAEIGDRGQAEKILQSYLQHHGDDYRAQLLLLDVQNTAASPVLHQAALWKLYNEHPESRVLCEHLFLYLLELNDLSGADSVLRHYQLATGRTQEPWLLDYRALLAAVRQDEGTATRLLRDRLLREDNWQARFNLAVLMGKAGQSRQAIEQLIEAENLLPEDRRQYFQSRIRSRIGEQYLLLGDVASARRECEYAIDLDISNFHAHRILRILERQ